MWERFEWFLTRLLPYAEAAGVRLAAHPNDPPLAVHRGMGCPLSTPRAYQRLLGIGAAGCALLGVAGLVAWRRSQREALLLRVADVVEHKGTPGHGR